MGEAFLLTVGAFLLAVKPLCLHSLKARKLHCKQEASNCSGKKKAHKHKSFWPVTGGFSRPGGRGSKIYVLSSEPKEHKSFGPDTRTGGPVTGATGQSSIC